MENILKDWISEVDCHDKTKELKPKYHLVNQIITTSLVIPLYSRVHAIKALLFTNFITNLVCFIVKSRSHCDRYDAVLLVKRDWIGVFGLEYRLCAVLIV
mmetsp:Transcript_100/g.171  ORF Transcript_100/g.171 Transcript_100/m.171 type:complete len:100 (-) Transcript_100:782-1081(-)